MHWGFDSIKDVLDVVLVPVVLALMPWIWEQVRSSRRRNAFVRLVIRELEEASPHPVTKVDGKKWTDHLKKEFVHQKVLASPADSLEFILNLDPDLIYFASQLWDSHKSKDEGQWRWYLKQLTKKYPRSKDLVEVHTKWEKLIESYKE